MRSTLSFVTAALCAAAFNPAAAQRVVAANYVRPVDVLAAVSADASLRPVAVYRFEASRVAGIPSQVTVADSAGTLVATFRLPGSSEPRPMMVELVGEDLVLHGDTPAGVLTLVLYGQSDGATAPLTGRWMLGSQQGELSGRAPR